MCLLYLFQDKLFEYFFSRLSVIAPYMTVFKASKMLFLTNELAKKAEITILSARKSTRPGFQAGASWVERKPFKRKGIVRDSHLGL